MKKNLSGVKKIFFNSKIFKYDYIYIYADLRFYLIKHGNNFAVDLLKLFLKKKKTIIVPTFSYTTSGEFFKDKTKSALGYFSNFILNSKKSLRSDHPLFSFTAIGPKKSILKNLGKSAFGNKGLHKKLYRKRACYLHIGRPLKQGNTMVHFFEKTKEDLFTFLYIVESQENSRECEVGKRARKS